MAAETVDVIIVGAGLSGLTAAREVQRAGYSCVVLEAEDRVGGMLLSVYQDSDSGNSKVAVDVGAAWLNDTTQSAIWGLVQRYGLTTETQDSEGELLREMEDGSIITGTEGNKKASTMSSFYATLGALVSTIDPAAPHTHPDAASLDRITLAQFCAQHTSTPLVSLLLNASVRYLVGAEASAVSALWFLAHCAAGSGLQNMMSARAGGGQHLRVREGTQRIALGLAGELAPGTVHLSTAVACIEQSSSSSVTVTASGGRAFHARRAILALPSTLHNTIAFRPAPLPPAKQRLADAAAAAAAAGTGFFAKATLVYDRPWWRDNDNANAPAGPLNGIFESVLGPVVYSRNTNVPALGHWSITGSVVGAPGARWGAIADREGRRRAVVEQLRNGFGAALEGGRDGVPEPVAYVEGLWTGRYAAGGGSVPVLGPGVLTAVGAAAVEPFGRVHFVGSETAVAWRGYMEGAVRSGLRGAEEVVAALGKEMEGGLQAAGKL
ncbi:hypothetical protein SLS58_008923 [Diplodia intermedia]|uniref:Amine oxidase n=1 Tax=Diplodia intermedia TaxID=856260 RepID=A0ABR3TF79_9PEZI